ncbi:MAG: hypothetical protein ACRD0Y_03205 [Terriglobales bacterium]
MRRSLQIVALVTLVLAPLFSFANSVAGRPICCWWMQSCAMAQPHGSMGAMAHCHMTAACNTVAPVPAAAPELPVPLFPPAAMQRQAASSSDAGSWHPPLAGGELAGFTPAVFHIPLA